MWKMFRYRCRECGYEHTQSERDSTLFMAECHALGTNHYDGILKKIDHSEDDATPLMPIVMYSKSATYDINRMRWVISR